MRHLLLATMLFGCHWEFRAGYADQDMDGGPDAVAVATAAPTTAPATAPATAAATAAPIFHEPPEPVEPPLMIPVILAEGRPKGLVEDAQAGVWIWHEDHAKLWHVRTTTRRGMHRFTGIVSGEGSPITELHLSRVDYNDQIQPVPRGIGFDFETQGHEDGFDFRVAGNPCVRFYAMVDQKAEPLRIFLGANDIHPPFWHFKLCPFP